MMGKKIICKSCAAEIDETEPKCPYCGTMNMKGAEAEYMEKLEKVREDMDGLDHVHAEVSEKIAKKRRKFFKVLFIVAGIYIAFQVIGNSLVQRMEDKRDREEMYWRLENYPIMNDMYDRGEYEEMYAYYLKGQEEGGDMYTWTHKEFCEAYRELLQVREILEAEQAGEELSAFDYENLLHAEARLLAVEYNETMSEEEKEDFFALAEKELEDYNTRWGMDEETKEWIKAELQNNYGYLSYDFCGEYVEKWYESREEEG